MEIQVYYDSRDIGVWLNFSNMNTLKRAIGGALNRTIEQVRTQASRSIRSQIKLKSKDINDRLVIIRANSNKGALSQLQAKLQVSGKPVPLISYGARATKGGVTVTVKNKRTVLKHAFITTMRSGHRGVFVRKGKARLPIQELYSTRVSDVFGNTGFIPQLTRFTEASFDKNFAHYLDYLFRLQPH